HHLLWHSRGGPTDIDNGALFCFYHHHLLHNGEWDARMGADGIVEVIPPTRIDPKQQPIRHDRFR
ncbi:MAG: HNH endonuclease, partial [Actinomycetota bacterium]|nr:HNH endonuclease [Actinomycetota bacterium]